MSKVTKTARNGYKLAALLVVMGLCYGAYAAAMVLSGPESINVPSGTTVTLSDPITGTGPLVLTGGGTLALSNGENDFTGGIIVSNGIVRADAAGSFGTGPITLEGDATVRTVELNANRGVFVNSITLKDKTTAKASPAVRATQSATVSGNLSIDPSLAADTEFWIATADTTTRFEVTGACNAGAARIGFTGNGKTALKGVVTADRCICGGSYSDNGNVEFWNRDNAISSVYLYAYDVYCKNTNVLYKSYIFFDWNSGWGANGHGFVFLSGYDQVFMRLHNRYLPAALDRDGYACAIPLTTSSEAHSVITLVGVENGDSSTACYAALNGNFSLVMDKVPSGKTMYQKIGYRNHKMKGDITLKNGSLYLQENATFPNVPKLKVEGGSLTFTGITNSLPALKTFEMTGGSATFQNTCVNAIPGTNTEYHLSSSAKLYLQTGVTNIVRKLFVDGAAMPAGIYTYQNLPLMKHSSAASYAGALDVRRGPKGLSLSIR